MEASGPGRLLGALALIASVAMSGCGTTTKSGAVGETLSGGGVAVTLERIDQHPPVPSDDVSGLSTPAPGDRLIGARLRVCSNRGQAIGTFNFSVDVAGGGSGSVKFPSMNYGNSFDVVRTGCARGWIVFELPRAGRASAISFRFDDTGNNSSVVAPGGRGEVHDHFSWRLE
jgi:hypothetical protein